MTYKKPNDVTYTEMCIYIDNNVYREDLSEEEQEKIYIYIYHICYMLACKSKYFNSFAAYDNFALYCATKLYGRLVDARQFENPPRLNKIKSILNYAKNTLYGMKVDWQKENFNLIIDPQVQTGAGNKNIERFSDHLKSLVQQHYRQDLVENTLGILENIPEIIYKMILTTPYRNDKIVVHNLYMSCLLSLTNMVTLSNDSLVKLANYTNFNDIYDYMDKLYQKEKKNFVIVWHLDESMRDYIQVLCNKIKKQIARSILENKQKCELTDEIFSAIMFSPNIDTNGYDKYENE